MRKAVVDDSDFRIFHAQPLQISGGSTHMKKFRSQNIRLWLLTLTIAMGFAAAWFEAATVASPKIGKLPKENVATWKLRTLNERELSLSEMRGQVVVLDFFAVWCSHSREHIPSTVRLSQAEDLRGVQFVGLAVQDDRTTSDKVQSFISEHKIAYPVAMISDPAFSRYVDSRDISVPQTLVYGRDGKLAAHFNGHNEKTEEALRNIIRRELDRK
jgi:thiol-disulfide isomerase/thioredoxin